MARSLCCQTTALVKSFVRDIDQFVCECTSPTVTSQPLFIDLEGKHAGVAQRICKCRPVPMGSVHLVCMYVRMCVHMYIRIVVWGHMHIYTPTLCSHFQWTLCSMRNWNLNCAQSSWKQGTYVRMYVCMYVCIECVAIYGWIHL